MMHLSLPLVLLLGGDAELDERDDATLDAQGSAEEAAPAGTSVPPPGPPTEPERFNRWSLQIAPGAHYIFFGAFEAYGPTFRFAGWVHAWRGKFMIGGGPSLHYTYLVDNTPSDDKVQLFTLDGDMVIGGGMPDKFAAYGHLSLGAGVGFGKDGETDTKILVPIARATAGAGVFGMITPMLSLGGLVDFGYMGGLGVEAFLTVGIHFGKKPK